MDTVAFNCDNFKMSFHCFTRKPSYRTDDRAMHPMYRCPKNVRDSLTAPMATFPKVLMAFVPIEPINVHTKFEVGSFSYSDIAAFVRQCAIFSHPTSSLPKISPCFHGNRWIMDVVWATKSEGVLLG